MKKSILMAVVAVCAASVAFASFRQPVGIVRDQHAVVDTLPKKDTTQLPPQSDTTTTPTDTSKTDTSSVIH